MRIFLFFVALGLSGSTLADERLWDLLRSGGQVVLIRHTITTPGFGDPPGMRLAFASAETSEALSNLFGRYENQERQVRALRALVAQAPVKASLVLVSQGALAGRLSVRQNAHE